MNETVANYEIKPSDVFGGQEDGGAAFGNRVAQKKFEFQRPSNGTAPARQGADGMLKLDRKPSVPDEELGNGPSIYETKYKA